MSTFIEILLPGSKDNRFCVWVYAAFPDMGV